MCCSRPFSEAAKIYTEKCPKSFREKRKKSKKIPQAFFGPAEMGCFRHDMMSFYGFLGELDPHEGIGVDKAEGFDHVGGARLVLEEMLRLYM